MGAIPTPAAALAIGDAARTPLRVDDIVECTEPRETELGPIAVGDRHTVAQVSAAGCFIRLHGADAFTRSSGWKRIGRLEGHRKPPPAASGTWRPISTAPMDGTVLDLWGTTALSGTTYEWRGRTHRRPTGERRPDVKWCTTHKCWRVAADLHYVHDLPGFTPTHWAPLTRPVDAP